MLLNERRPLVNKQVTAEKEKEEEREEDRRRKNDKEEVRINWGRAIVCFVGEVFILKGKPAKFYMLVFQSCSGLLIM